MAFRHQLACWICGLALLCTPSLFAQKMNQYDKQWKKIDSLVNQKGLVKSALEEVNKLYQTAKKEKQEAQRIKALVYKLGLEEGQQEDADNQTIRSMETEIAAASGASKAILQSLLAEKYVNWFQNHRWELYDRTKLAVSDKKDIATMTASDIHEKIASLYLSSLKERGLLQQTKLAAFDAIINKGNTRQLRSTLFDLLAHRALSYFKSNERDIDKPAYAFEIDNPSYFAPAADFVKLKIEHKDSSALYLHALQLYQELLRFHLADNTPDAMLDADLDRLQFVHQYAVMEKKDRLYEDALTTITEQYKDHPASAQALYLLALQHMKTASLYKPLAGNSGLNAIYKDDYVKAAQLCQAALQQKEESEGRTNCYNLLQQIKRKELQLHTEKVNLPNLPFRTLVNFRNISKAYLRLVKISDEQLSRLAQGYDDAYWKELMAVPATKNWSQELPATNDYQQHSSEIKVNELPVGNYLLLASASSDWTFEQNPLAVQYFYVSAISYINNNNDYFVLNRETGQPLAGATVQTWWAQYDYSTRTNKRVKGEQKTADKNGYVELTGRTDNRYGNLQLEISTSNDRLFMNDAPYVYYRDPSVKPAKISAEQFEKEHAQIFFFTDRSIYRPGQTVYFKAIAVTTDMVTRKSKLYTGIHSKAILHDVNGEELDSLQITTSEYGSYSGKFVLPQNLLNGEFSIIDSFTGSETSFSVEEYKRPKFQVEYEPLKGSYRVNDSIEVTGTAKAYAGNTIDGAKVEFRIRRNARFPYPWLYWRYGAPASSAMEIAHGTIKTDSDGKFKIRFTAIPDASIDPALDPSFDYAISADVTDINGETRSGSTTVPAAYTALRISLDLINEQSIEADSLKQLRVTTQNTAGNPEPALVNLKISQLRTPARLIRKRFWQQPDLFVIDSAEFIKDFPYDEYQNESDYRSWTTEKVWFNKTDSSNTKNGFNLAGLQLPQGWYAIEASTQDKFGKEVKTISYVQLTQRNAKNLPALQYEWTSGFRPSYKPGETAHIEIGSSADNIFLIQELSKQAEKSEEEKPVVNTYNYLQLNGKQGFDFPIGESDRGGFGLNHFFVKHNRFYSMPATVAVPWTNKDLEISYETFRDKTLPGSEEKWKVTIKGWKKDKVAVEMLASMYDASLDQFKPHSWQKPELWPSFNQSNQWDGRFSFAETQSKERYFEEHRRYWSKEFDQFSVSLTSNQGRRALALSGRIAGVAISDASPGSAPVVEMAKAVPARSEDMAYNEIASTNKDKHLDEVVVTSVSKKPNELANPTSVQIRKNFNETAFFFPDLKTDSAGNIEFGFTMPEALTQWKFQSLAHTKDLAFGYSSRTLVTQKPLMIQPNAPRFLREGDKLELVGKVVNVTDQEITGTVQLTLLNTATNQPVDGWFRNMYPVQYFTVAPHQSSAVKFSVDVPYQYNSAVSYRFIAEGAPTDSTQKDIAKLSDGEEAALPVLSNSMLVTESMPLPMRGNSAKNFRFEKLLQSGNSETLQQHALTVEFTTNPAWYAVQALPYLMEYPYECAEQTFNRYYANALATKIANASPKLKAVFESWKTSDTAALLSNLQKNPELKSILLEETPWVLDAKNETQQKKNIALLFNMVRMSSELGSALNKLQQLQSENGGFVWFKGGPDDRYMTQYILTGLGHLSKLGALPESQKNAWNDIIQKAIPYIDARIKEDYDLLRKHKANLKQNNTSYTQIQYLYMRSFFTDYPIPGGSFTAVNYYRQQCQQYWLQQNKYMQGMIALALHRTGDKKTANDIIKSLGQTALNNEEMGMYWKENAGGYYWHQAPVETQSLLIEAFSEISQNEKTVADLKTWLLKQKQTQNWTSTKATAEACYALLLRGSDWLNSNPIVEIQLGDKKIPSATEKTEAGTGYFKKRIEGPFVNPGMGEISVKIANQPGQTAPPAWGAVYWQYFEQLDKIKGAVTPLQLTKQLFVEKNTDRGPVLEAIADNAYLKVGDKLKVRVELRVDRDMEYVHMKDMRASGTEPVNVLSGYKWQGALGYYESTKDASTNFFFSWLPKGTYVFEYPLFVQHAGDFSTGVTSIQCMYAPEFSSHSEGLRIHVE